MVDSVKQLLEAAQEAIAASTDARELDAARVQYLGKNQPGPCTYKI